VVARARQFFYKGAEVDQVNLPSTAGDMGVLANHVPIIAQLRPGTIEVLDGKAPKKFFGASAKRSCGCRAAL